MLRYNSISDMLIDRSILDDVGITFIKGSDQEEFLSYKELFHSARNMLAFLQSEGIQPRDEMLIQVEDGRSFIIVFWACILGGIIPVPLTVGHNDDHREKLFNVWMLMRAPRVIISPQELDKLAAFAARTNLGDLYDTIRSRAVDLRSAMAFTGKCDLFTAKTDDIAFIQFSSGSTGSPKGVVLTNRNLIVNMQAISSAAHYSSADKMMSWMPLTHDMGLIGFHLNPLFAGVDQYLLPTDLFIRRPTLWPAKASEHQVSILCSPNFGYEYVIRHCGNLEQYDWDLSRVRIIYNGAEPVSEHLCREFTDKFSKYGLKRSAMCPVYGLAEASLAVSISGLADEVMAIALDRNATALGGRITEIGEGGKGSISFVNVGRPVDDCSVRISIDEQEAAGEERIGHVQIKGDNVTGGYYNNEIATKDTFTPDGWLKTGDIGFMKNGSLYITGRAKDIIFINGRNYYPHDIERVAAAIPGIGLNKIAVAGYYNSESQREETVAFVLYKGTLDSFRALATSVKAHVGDRMGIQIDSVLPVKHMPKTTSGKLQRFKLVEELRSGIFKDSEYRLNQFGESSPDKTPTDHIANERELRLIAIWRKVLQREDIGIDQNFFEIGGNSLKAAEMSMLLWKELQFEIPIESIYEWKTIKELAIAMDMPAAKTYRPIPAAGEREYYPASVVQKGLYYFWDTNRNSRAYNVPLAVRISGRIDKDVLEGCIKQLISRHDALRMSFHLLEEPKFKVHDNSEFSLTCLQCSNDGLDDKLKSMVRPFDLSVHPLFRFVLVEVAGQEPVLFMDFHHIVTDGLSIYRLLDELLQLYTGKRLPDLPVKFSDFACWERERLGEDRPKLQKANWVRQLEGELPVLKLPIDFKRPPVFNTDGAKLAFHFDPETSNRLRQLARQNACTLHSLLFAIYSVTLSKYTGQDDLLIGIPAAGRMHPDLQQLQGLFVNNLVIRSTIKGDESFTGFLRRMNVSIQEAILNQGYPFEELVEKVAMKRDVGRNPLFDTMFVYQNMGLPSTGEPAVSITRHFFDPGISKFDLSLEIFESEGSIPFYFEYATNLFARTTITKIAGHFNDLAQEIIADPGCLVADLSALTLEEYRFFVEAFNHTRKNYPEEKTIHRLFEEQVRRTPENIAIEGVDHSLTFAGLNEKADHLASLLAEKGVKRGDVVGIFLRRRPQLIIGILGVLKAGACYLPMDAEMPDNRIGFLVTNSRCKLIIAGKETIDRIDPGSFRTEILDIDEPETPKPRHRPVKYVSAPRDLAYIIYTSGTTGNPKGVAIEHRSLVNYIYWAATVYTGGEKLNFPFYTSVAFDLTVTSIFVPLTTGGKIVVYPESEDDLAIEKVISDNKVDIIKLTPSHLKIIRANAAFGRAAGSRVRALIVGGEALETQLAGDISEKFGGTIEIYNEYGPTEATVGCMIHRYEPGTGLPSVPIGIPASNTAIYLLDKYLRPVLPGTEGEIYISGDSLARGYLFNETLTAEKFIRSPISPGQRMYKTGDLGRQLPDAVVLYAGRVDQQVKISGYRIEPGEIENCLAGYRGIAEAVVHARKNKDGQQTLVGYYKIAAGSEEVIDEVDLKSHLATVLPHYMIPARLVPVSHIPLTRNGKIDYDALPAPEDFLDIRESTRPLSPIETSLMEVWKSILGKEDLRLTDSFIMLGGDSIKAVQIASRLSGMGVIVSSRDILTYHTIEQISRHARIVTPAAPSGQGIIEGERRLTPIERWFFSQRFEKPGHYNQSILVQFNRPIDVALLEKAIETLIGHHDGLRMNYNPEKDVLFYNNSFLKQAFVIGLDKDADACFDLAADLLLKATLVKEEDEMLRLTLHHLLIDGISWRVLLEDLYALYRSLERGSAPHLPAKTASTADWAEELHAFIADRHLAAEKDYWDEIDRSRRMLPQDFETNDWRTRNRGRAEKSLSRETTHHLLGQARQAYNADVLILLNTALVLTLKGWTDQPYYVVEQESHGRLLDTIDTSRTLGWFTAIYPARLKTTRGDMGDQLAAVKEALDNVPHNGLGYLAARYSVPPAAHRKNPATVVRLNYLGEFGSEMENDLFTFSDKSTGSDVAAENTMSAGLEMNVMVIQGILRVEMYYNRKAYFDQTIDRLLDAFLGNLVKLPDHLKREDTPHIKPSRFQTVDLDDEELNALFS